MTAQTKVSGLEINWQRVKVITIPAIIGGAIGYFIGKSKKSTAIGFGIGTTLGYQLSKFSFGTVAPLIYNRDTFLNKISAQGPK